MDSIRPRLTRPDGVAYHFAFQLYRDRPGEVLQFSAKTVESTWDTGVGSSSILDPTGLPLKGAPSPVIGGVYVGDLTNRNVVAVPQQPQVIPGSLSTGAVGTAFLGPSPDSESNGTCRAVFAVVTADGAIVQEHTQKGLDGLAPAGTVQPLRGRTWGSPN